MKRIHTAAARPFPYRIFAAARVLCGLLGGREDLVFCPEKKEDESLVIVKCRVDK